MKKPGIIIRDTFHHLPAAVVENCRDLYGEPEYLNAGWRQLFEESGIFFHPMISGYLGAKTQRCKFDEMEFLRGNDHPGALYFFDAKNIKFNDFGLFRQEIESAENILSDPESAVYLPVDFFTLAELGRIVSVIKPLRCRIIAYFSDELAGTDNFNRIIAELSADCGRDAVICAFSGLQMLKDSEKILSGSGIEKTAYYR